MKTRNRSRRLMVSVSKLLAPIAVLVVLLTPRTAEACFVAFVHGHQTPAQTGNPEAYWNPEVLPSTPIGGGSIEFSFTFWAAEDLGCEVTRIQWNSTLSFRNRAVDVANKINLFITAKGIPAQELIIIAHSMGGLVTRYILNNSTSGSPAFNSKFTKVATATKYLITSQSPHTGTRGADAIANEDNNPFVHLFGSLARDVGWAPRDNGTDSMRRVDMEFGSAAGGSMGDSFRTRRIYTIDGFRVGALAGPDDPPGNINRGSLESAWAALCYTSHILNLFTCPEVAGDGLVEQRSAQGILQRSGRWDGSRFSGVLFPTNYSTVPTDTATCGNSACKSWTSGSFMKGRRTRWLRYGGDHDQGRYDRFDTEIHNYTTGVAEDFFLASYIGENGHRLAL